MNEKQEILKEIERLLSYGDKSFSIDPNLLQYLKIEDLESIKRSLLAKVGVLSDENKEWLEQFKKYD
ncbi:MAG TPA: hypothetical protein ENN12_02005 [Epsilonproteobacteria bacterium]|nr:hypothetical protein [Campylobacterota bacterium]